MILLSQATTGGAWTLSAFGETWPIPNNVLLLTRGDYTKKFGAWLVWVCKNRPISRRLLLSEPTLQTVLASYDVVGQGTKGSCTGKGSKYVACPSVN